MAVAMSRARGRQGAQPLPESPVAHLVVGLELVEEGPQRQAGAGLAPGGAAPEGGGLSLEGEALGQTAAQVSHGIVGIVRIVAALLPGGEQVHGVVEIIVPLGGAGPRRSQAAGLVAVVLQHQVDLPPPPRPVAHRRRQFLQEVRPAVVQDGVDRVQAQTVQMELLQPVERVVDEEVPHGPGSGPVEVDHRTPRRLVGSGEEGRRVGGQVVALRTEVVVHHVQHHHEPAPVGSGHQPLEVLGRSIGMLRRERQHTVVAPVAQAGELRHRHQLEDGGAQPGQVVQAPLHPGERALRGEGAHVQFVDHGLRPGPPAPVPVRPAEGQRVAHLAGAMDPLGVAPGSGIRHPDPPVDFKAVQAADPGFRAIQREPAAGHRQHGQGGRGLQDQRHRARAGRPKPEPGPAARQELRAEGHGVDAVHPCTLGTCTSRARERPSRG
jgi:hypothetical protein